MNSQKANQVLENIAREFGSSDTIPEYMAAAYIQAPEIPCSKWSWGNRLAISFAGTSDARGFRQWNKIGRHVKKGSKAIHILAPITVKKDDDDIRVVGFRVVPVFAARDTEGKPIPVYQPTVIPPLAGLANIKYENSETGESGSYDIKARSITLCSEDPAVYFHELVHKYDAKTYNMKNGQDPEQEIVAELGACILARLYNVERRAENHMAYIAAYAKAKAPAEVGAACMRMAERTMQAISLILHDAAKLV